MLVLTANAVLSTALTDLINALALLPMLLLLRPVFSPDHPQGLFWHKLLRQIALSCFLGFVLHIRPWPNGPLVGIWLVLYVVLLETLRTLLTLVLCTSLRKDALPPPITRLLRVIQTMVFSILAIFLLCHQNPIRLFLLYGGTIAAISIYYLFRLARQGHRGSQIFLLVLVPQIPGLALQFLRRGEYALLGLDFNGLHHLCILLSLLILYFAAKNWNTYK